MTSTQEVLDHMPSIMLFAAVHESAFGRNIPDLIPFVVEELLRYEPPAQFLPKRTTLDEIALAGTSIPKGAFLTLALAAGNRDPARFADPDRFDPERRSFPENEFFTRTILRRAFTRGKADIVRSDQAYLQNFTANLRGTRRRSRSTGCRSSVSIPLPSRFTVVS